MTRGLLTPAALRARCIVDAQTHCWLWTGAKDQCGTPRIWTFDHARGEKRVMSGPKAAWNIAHQAAPRAGWLVYRRCGVKACLCPSHLEQARGQAEIGLQARLSGRRKGTHAEARRPALEKAWATQGIKVTPAEVVRACRAAGPEITNVALAAVHGIHHSTVSGIRLELSHRGVV